MAHLNFAWDNPNAPANITYSLYENGTPVVTKIGALDFSLDMTGKADGTYQYYVTSVDSTTGLESKPSNTVSADFLTPAAPTSLTASWAA